MSTGELGYPHIQAYYYTRGRQWDPPIWIVLHCTDVAEHPMYAEDLGRFFARRRSDGQQVSTHFGVDNNSIVQYVRMGDVAYGARAIPNNRGIHIELSGLARQTRAQWLDAFGLGLIDRAAELITKILARYPHIPVRMITDQQMRDRAPGITTHAQCTRVLGGTHTDPGPGFPVDQLLAAVRARMGTGGTVTLPEATPTQSRRRWRPDDTDISSTRLRAGTDNWEQAYRACYLEPKAGLDQPHLVDHMWRLRLANHPGPGQWEHLKPGTVIKVPPRLGY